MSNHVLKIHCPACNTEITKQVEKPDHDVNFPKEVILVDYLVGQKKITEGSIATFTVRCAVKKVSTTKRSKDGKECYKIEREIISERITDIIF